MINKLNEIQADIKPKNKFWSIIAKLAISALKLIITNQKGIKGNQQAIDIVNNVGDAIDAKIK